LAGFQQSTFWGFLCKIVQKFNLKTICCKLKKHAKFWRKQNKILGNIFVTLQHNFQFTSLKEFGQFSTNDLPIDAKLYLG
jgi:hypothetical protein